MSTNTPQAKLPPDLKFNRNHPKGILSVPIEPGGLGRRGGGGLHCAIVELVPTLLVRGPLCHRRFLEVRE